MKICFLTPEYPHQRTKTSGGIGTSIKNLSTCLSLHYGYDVRVLVTGQNSDASFVDEGVEIHTMKNVTTIKGMSWFLTRKKIQRIINNWIKSGQVDIVESPDWGALTAFTNINCPVIVRLNGTDTYFCNLDNRPVKRFNHYLESITLRKADSIIAVSQFVGEQTNKLFGLSKPFSVIQNGLNADNFKPIKANDESPFTILYFGTLIRKKGALDLPLIFNKVNKLLPDARLLIIGRDASDILTGSGSTWSLMEPLFSKNAYEQTEYVGSVPYSSIRAYIGEATVCVFPSYAECWPMSWMEAMAMEKAVVTSNIGWAAEMITDGQDGLMVHPSNHTSFANAIISFSDKSFRDKIAKAARKKVESHFSDRIIAEKTINHYKQIIRLA